MYGIDSKDKNQRIYLLSQIVKICKVFGNGSNNNADELVYKTLVVESQFGSWKLVDYKFSGHGVGQADMIAVQDTTERLRRRPDLIEKTEQNFGITLDDFIGSTPYKEYIIKEAESRYHKQHPYIPIRFHISDHFKEILLQTILDYANCLVLRNDPITSILYTRFRYLFVPEAIPAEEEEQYRYYKKYYNSCQGAGSYEKWIRDTQTDSCLHDLNVIRAIRNT